MDNVTLPLMVLAGLGMAYYFFTKNNHGISYGTITPSVDQLANTYYTLAPSVMQFVDKMHDELIRLNHPWNTQTDYYPPNVDNHTISAVLQAYNIKWDDIRHAYIQKYG